MLVDGRSLTRAQLGDAEILLVRSVTRVDSGLLDGSNIRLVGTATSGIDHLDINYLRGREIAYFDAAGCNARAVAEYVLACGFLHGRLAFDRPGAVQAGIIGYGHAGKIVCSMLTALGVRCVINDPPLAEATTDDGFVELEEALASDIVTLHVPYTETGNFPTRGLIGLTQLRRLRPGALLINAARGRVVDEGSLVAWLKQRAHTAVAIDCWAGEPAVDLALLRLAALATPHIAGHTSEARLRATTTLSHKLAANRGSEARWLPRREDPFELRLERQGRRGSTDVLRDAVLHCCDPREATTRMRKMIGLPKARRGVYFDELRRHAATRREFGSYLIPSASLQPGTVRALRELGFNTTTDGMANGSTQ